MNINRKNVGDLYQLKSSIKFDKHYPPRFCAVVDNKIKNVTKWYNRFPVTHQTLPMMLVKADMALTPETAGAVDCWATAMWPTVSATCRLLALAAKDSDIARDQWLENKCIPGSVFMVPDGQLIWISDIDLKYFEKVEL